MRRKLLLSATPVVMALCSVIAVHAQPLRPAPTEDRVGFPDGYRESYNVFYTFDRSDNRQVRMVYGNDEATSTEAGRDFPYGSILVMESYRALVVARTRPRVVLMDLRMPHRDGV